MGTDYTNVVADGERGRKSIRLQSKQSYSGNNLIVIDLEHMPTTVGSLNTGCASWPAFWTVGPDWPTKGEIDIIEYVNTEGVDMTTLHTNAGCDQSNEDTAMFSGVWSVGTQNNPSDNCDVNAVDQWTNQGCGIIGIGSTNPQPKVGAMFNKLGKGGVYALEWLTDNYIRAFYFERDDIPADLQAHDTVTPDPATWGLPYASFELGADCSSDHFKNHNIIFDNTFCGDWAGATFASTCSATVSCEDYVRNNPSFFQESYWLINYVDVYEVTAAAAAAAVDQSTKCKCQHHHRHHHRHHRHKQHRQKDQRDRKGRRKRKDHHYNKSHRNLLEHNACNC